MISMQAPSRSRGHVVIDFESCKGCGLCLEVCAPKVLQVSPKLNRMGYHPAVYAGSHCTGCGVCFYVCPEPAAITVFKRVGAPAKISEMVA